MARKRVKPEQIIHMLREAEVKLAGASTTPEACRALGISEQIYYRWRREYGGMQVSQAKKLKDLERENARPFRMLTVIEEYSRQCLAIRT